MNEEVKGYLQKKYPNLLNPEEYDRQRELAEAQMQEQSANLPWAQFASGLGATIAGRDPGQVVQPFEEMRRGIRERTVGELEKQRAGELKRLEGQEYLEAMDPQSTKSQAFRKMIESQFPDVVKTYGDLWGGVSAADAESIFKPLQLGESIAARREQAQILADTGYAKAGNELIKLQDLKAGREEQQKLERDKLKLQERLKTQELGLRREQLSGQKSKEQTKEKKLSSADKARFDNALMVLKGIDEMGAALDKGQNTFSLVGDNDFTAAERRATEAFGRMQSGGAINKDEEARFKKTLPTATDSKEIQRKKLITQRNEMLSRLKTLGFTPENIAEEVGYTPQEFQYGKSKQETKTVVKKQYSPARDQTRIQYSDGTSEIKQGKQ